MTFNSIEKGIIIEALGSQIDGLKKELADPEHIVNTSNTTILSQKWKEGIKTREFLIQKVMTL